jgi:type I site-specific restriction endonuclease
MYNIDFGTGRFQFLCNCGTHTEGYDNPEIRLVVMARPTLSRSLYTQCIGRGTRPLPGLVDSLESADDRRNSIAASDKPSVEVLDFVGNSTRHKLVSTLDILGGEVDKDERNRARKIVEGMSSAASPEEVVEEAIRQVAQEREEKRVLEEEERKNVMASVDWSKATVDPFNTLDLRPETKTSTPGTVASEKQIVFLAKKVGIDARGWTNKEASRAIGRFVQRAKGGLSTPRQISLLEKHGYDGKDMTRRDASKLIDNIKANGWQRLDA